MSTIRVELRLDDGSFVSGMLRSGQTLDSFRKELARVDPHFNKMDQASRKAAAGVEVMENSTRRLLRTVRERGGMGDMARQLTLLDPSFRRVSLGAGGVVSSFKRADDTSKSFLGTLRDISIVGGFAIIAFNSLVGASNGMIGSIIRVNAEMEKLRFQMEGMSSAADPVREAADSVAYLREMAASAPFSLRELNSTFVKLKASGIDPMTGSMQGLVDGIAAFGGSDEQLHRVTLGITQMSGKGVIQMEEMRQQLGEAMPSAMRLMARSMGVSVAELTKAIATGQVEAKAALTSFIDELERSYGGEAQRMMGTFSGQVTQLYANLQKLATGDGLSGFFETVKEYLQGVNDALNSPQAKRAAAEFGEMLVSVMEVVGQGASVIYQFRQELMALLIAFGSAQAIRATVAIFATLSNSLTLVMAQLGPLRLALQSAAASMNMAGIAAASGASRFVQARYALAALGIAAKGFGGAIMVAMPYLAAFGTALYIASDYFGLFSNKAEEAYENVREFGAATREEAASIIAAQRAQLEGEISSLEEILSGVEPGSIGSGTAYYQEVIETLDRLKGKLKEVNDAEADILRQSSENEYTASIAKQERLLRERTNAFSRDYNKRQILIDETYQRELDSAAENGKDIEDIREKYQQDTIENQRRLAKEQIAVYDSELKRLEGVLDNAREAERAGVLALIDFVSKQKAQVVGQMTELSDREFGIKFSVAPEDESDKIEDAKADLEDLRVDVQGLEADLAGASGAYARMLARIKRGDYGSIEKGEEYVLELHEALLMATRQKEMLDKLMKGDEAAKGDLENLRQDVLRRRMELEENKLGSEATEADKFLLRLRSGFYDGLGPIENIRESIYGVTEQMNTQGVVADEVARVMNENTFGDETLAQIEEVAQAIRNMTTDLRNLGSLAAQGLTFGIAGAAGSPAVVNNVDGGILDLIASRESGGDYNATLDNGAYTGGPRNLTGMTLREIRALQDQMLAHPANKKNSSALGRYQIVGKTLQGLMDRLGLTGDELFDEDMQDMLGKQLVMGRGRSAAGLRAEWEGLNGVSDEAILGAYDRSTTGPTRFNAGIGSPRPGPIKPIAASGYDDSAFRSAEADRVRRTNELEQEALKLKADEVGIRDEEFALARSKAIDEFIAKIKDSTKNVEELGKNYEATLEAIRAGDFGPNKDVNAAEYAKLLEMAKALDEAERVSSERKSARTESERQLADLEEERLRINQEIADAQARAQNPDYMGMSEDLIRLNEQLDAYLRNVELAYGKDSEEYKRAQETKSETLALAKLKDAEEIRAGLAEERIALEDSIATTTQARQNQMERELALLDQKKERMIAAGMDEIRVTEEIEQQKALVREKYAKEGLDPWSAQLEEWGKLQDAFQQGTAEWTDGLASGMAQLLRGTGDLEGALNSMLDSMAEMAVQYMLSGLGASKQSPGAAGKQAFAKMASGGKLGVGVAHTGGIAGGRLAGRVVSPAAFIGAQKYHTGGIVGGPKFKPGEIPIIAKKNEGIFTPEQMEHLGGFSNNQSFAVNTTVNASGGSPEQNADLAKQISRELEATVRGQIMKEMVRQSRPGNMMNRG